MPGKDPVGARPAPGRLIRRETGADMVFWNGACIVHDEFKAFELEAPKKDHPGAKVLVHPNRPPT